MPRKTKKTSTVKLVGTDGLSGPVSTKKSSKPVDAKAKRNSAAIKECISTVYCCLMILGVMYAGRLMIDYCTPVHKNANLDGRCFMQEYPIVSTTRRIVAKALYSHVPYSMEQIAYEFVDLDNGMIDVKSRYAESTETSDDGVLGLSFKKVYPAEVNCTIFEAYKTKIMSDRLMGLKHEG